MFFFIIGPRVRHQLDFPIIILIPNNRLYVCTNCYEIHLWELYWCIFLKSIFLGIKCNLQDLKRDRRDTEISILRNWSRLEYSATSLRYSDPGCDLFQWGLLGRPKHVIALNARVIIRRRLRRGRMGTSAWFGEQLGRFCTTALACQIGVGAVW